MPAKTSRSLDNGLRRDKNHLSDLTIQDLDVLGNLEAAKDRLGGKALNLGEVFCIQLLALVELIPCQC